MKPIKPSFTLCLGAFALAPSFTPLPAAAQHALQQHELEEVFVSGELSKTGAETALPIDILSGEALRKAVGSSLGDTLQHQPGVRSASFGSGVGLPVIRGQSGPRVSIVQNSISSLDAAASSQDHANSVDPLVAERIEIIRGPATLLYGNGAIGGVVNVIDNRIPETLPDGLTSAIEARHNTVASENAGAFKIENKVNRFAWHLDGAFRDSGDTSIPGYAMNEHALVDDDHHDEEHELEGDDHDAEVENSYGFIANSDRRSHSLAGGGSWIGERGFIGFSVSRLDNEYGLPPGSHAHVEEEHEGEEDADEHAEHSDIRIDLKQTRYEVKGGLDTQGFFNRVNARLAYNDYEHVEFIIDDLHETVDRHDSARFTNRGFDSRFTAHHEHHPSTDRNLQGVIGMQLSGSTFSVEGEEGFIPRTDIESVGLFALESVSTGRWIYELGARLEHIAFTPEMGCDRDDISWSASAAAIWRALDSVNISLSAGRAERAPGVEERYSNVDTSTCAISSATDWQVHSPTGLIELGNPDLSKETSNNIELALHKHVGDIHGQVSIYFNRANNYIYLSESDVEIEPAVAHYRQDDAEFYGYEAELNWPVKVATSRQLEFTLFSDGVHAERTNGEYLPRIPPNRTGLAVTLVEHDWSLTLQAAAVASGDRLAPGETPTDSYTLVDLNADYHFTWGQHEVLLFAQGSNLLNETIRNHTSFAKNLAPEPGRGLKAGVRVVF